MVTQDGMGWVGEVRMMSVHAETCYEGTHGGLAVCNRRESSLAETEESKGTRVSGSRQGQVLPKGH